ATLQDGIPASRLITRQRRFQMDDGGDLHEQILHAEAHIGELTDRATSEGHPYFNSRHCCRRNLDLGIIIGAVGFGPTILVGSLAAVFCRTAVFVANSAPFSQTSTAM